MIGLEDRQALAQDIHTAHVAGARLRLACEVAGIELRTLQRWKAIEGGICADRRPLSMRPTPRHALSEAERTQVLAVANEPRFAAVPPARMVPMLADEGIYLASESPSAECCVSTVKLPSEDGPRRPGNSECRPRTLPPRHARCGAGT